jgi:hypothetical protein
MIKKFKVFEKVHDDEILKKFHVGDIIMNMHFSEVRAFTRGKEVFSAKEIRNFHEKKRLKTIDKYQKYDPYGEEDWNDVDERFNFGRKKKNIIQYNPQDPYGEENWDEVEFKKIEPHLFYKKTSAINIAFKRFFDIYLELKDFNLIFIGRIVFDTRDFLFKFSPSKNIKKGRISDEGDLNGLAKILIEPLLTPINNYFNQNKDVFNYIISNYEFPYLNED